MNDDSEGSIIEDALREGIIKNVEESLEPAMGSPSKFEEFLDSKEGYSVEYNSSDDGALVYQVEDEEAGVVETLEVFYNNDNKLDYMIRE